MLRTLLVPLGLMSLGAGVWALARDAGAYADLVGFGRILAVAGLLFLAVLIPLLIDLREDRLKVPWRDAARFLAREAHIEAAIFVLLAVSLAVAVFPFGAPLTAAGALALIVLGAAGAAAGTVAQLWGYAVPEPEFVEV